MAEMKNIRILRDIRHKGAAVVKDTVLPKSDFKSQGDWRNLCGMEPPKAIETNEPVGTPKASKKTTLPGV